MERNIFEMVVELSLSVNKEYGIETTFEEVLGLSKKQESKFVRNMAVKFILDYISGESIESIGELFNRHIPAINNILEDHETSYEIGYHYKRAKASYKTIYDTMCSRSGEIYLAMKNAKKERKEPVTVQLRGEDQKDKTIKFRISGKKREMYRQSVKKVYGDMCTLTYPLEKHIDSIIFKAKKIK